MRYIFGKWKSSPKSKLWGLQQEWNKCVENDDRGECVEELFHLIDMDKDTSIGFPEFLKFIVAIKELDAEVMDGFKSLSDGKKNVPMKEDSKTNALMKECVTKPGTPARRPSQSVDRQPKTSGNAP